jgi:hypothetical protein
MKISRRPATETAKAWQSLRAAEYAMTFLPFWIGAILPCAIFNAKE